MNSLFPLCFTSGHLIYPILNQSGESQVAVSHFSRVFLKLNCGCFNFEASNCCCGGLVELLKSDAASEGEEDRKLSSQAGWTDSHGPSGSSCCRHARNCTFWNRKCARSSLRRGRRFKQDQASARSDSIRPTADGSSASGENSGNKKHLNQGFLPWITWFLQFITRVQESFWMESFSPKNKRRLHFSCNNPN